MITRIRGSCKPDTLPYRSFLVNLEHLLALHHHTAANAHKAHQLLSQYGSLEATYSVTKSRERCVHEELELISRHQVTLLSYFDADYPESLKILADPPLLLYVKGKISIEECIAIVGTRQCSRYGAEMAEKLAIEITEKGFNVTSGLARGIDTHAHKGALKRGKTIAILGSGLLHLYPRENLKLAEEIAEQGALISEYPLHYPPAKHFFPKRNRLVSALSLGTLLIEAPLKSGAMLTMECADNQNKILMTIPGPIDQEGFRGNHFLLKTQKAFLVENGSDVVSLLKPGVKFSTRLKEKSPSFLFDPEEKELLKHLPQGEISLDEILLRVNVPVAKLNSLLMRLVLKEAIKEYPGKFYKKVVY